MEALKAILLALPDIPEEKPAQSPGGGGLGPLGSMLPFLLILVVMMLFLPLFSKKERTRQKRVQALKKHDRVVTSGGLYGTVISMDEQTATLEVAKGVRLTFKRSSIYDIDRESDASSSPETSEKQAKS
jgi:preprotein translocase subunit YajC